MGDVEHEICGNCKKEIPHFNYVMHTAHCARNITLCKVCKEPVPKSQFQDHAQTCIAKPKRVLKEKTPELPKTNLEKSHYFQSRKDVEDRKQTEKRERYLERHEKFLDRGYSMKSPKSPASSSYDRRKSSSSRSSLEETSAFRTATQQNSSIKSSVSKDSLSSSQMNNLSSPINNLSKPMNNLSKPMNNLSKPMNNLSKPANNLSKPMNNLSQPMNNLSQPISNGTGGGISNGTGAFKKTDTGSTGAVPKSSSGMLSCRYCDLDLPKMELEEHENYCGTRTDRCLDCGELVMYKNKQVHIDTNHGFLKLKDEPGPKASWDSTTERSNAPLSPPRRRRFQPTVYTDFSQFDPTDYLPSNYQIPKAKIEKGESYKEISRRLDCKTEYIRNLLHDSASITVPLRHAGTAPRNHFNHNKGPAPQPPSRRRNPPSELCIPCEFCDTPIPHEELIQHETGCRPDLARINLRSRRRQSLEEDEYFAAGPEPSSPEIELPCEFCSDMIPASQLLRHQATCG